MHNNPQITFIDLFAGIGGFHLAFSGGGCKCLFASEIDPNAQKTYHLNFPKTLLFGDITLPKIKFHKILIFYVLDFLVKLFLLLDTKKDLKIQEAHYSLKLQKSQKNINQKCYF